MKKYYKKAVSVIMSTTLIMSMIPIVSASNYVSAESTTLQNPRIVADTGMESGQKVTWDCVWFGSYPQAEVIPSGEYTALDSSLLQDGDTIVSDELYSKLQNATGWDPNGDITIDGNKYRRISKSDATGDQSGTLGFYNWSDSNTYHYFKYESIKWRVLNVNGNDAFLLADKGLDDKVYDKEHTDVTWETSTIRSWLNGYGSSANAYGTDYSSSNFLDTAFSASEQSVIKTTTVVNLDSIEYKTEGGNNTNDKVFLLSESEVYTDNAKSYGFVASYNTYDETRRSKSSTYAKAMGARSSATTEYQGNGYWWLRSPGDDVDYADYTSYVYSDGYIIRRGEFVVYSIYMVRPALHLNLSSSNLYSYAGTVCSDGRIDEIEPTNSSENQDNEQTTKAPSATQNDGQTTQSTSGTQNKGQANQSSSGNKNNVQTAQNQTGNQGSNQTTQNVTGAQRGGKQPADGTKQKQTITAKSYKKAYGSKAFKLKAKTSGDGRLTYKSNNIKVAKVNKNGKVTLKGYGKATITIKALATAKYNEAVKKVTVKVVPKKTKLKKVLSSGKKEILVKWKKNKKVTGYEICFSTKKNFSKALRKKKIKDNKSKTSLTGLKSGKKYYVKIRSFKKVGKKKYYSAWSKMKKVKVK